MNINSTKFKKRIIKEDDNYFLEINLELKFKELEYKIFGKGNIIQQGKLKKYKKNIKIKIFLENFQKIFFLVRINNFNEYYEIIDKKDLIKMKYDIKYNKNIKIQIEKKTNFEFDNINNLIKDFTISNDNYDKNNNMICDIENNIFYDQDSYKNEEDENEEYENEEDENEEDENEEGENEEGENEEGENEEGENEEGENEEGENEENFNIMEN